MIEVTSRCEVCQGESCTKDIGVAAIPGAPMSIMWGDKCLRRDRVVVPDFAAAYFLEGGIEQLNPEVRQWLTWSDKRYMTLEEYARTHTVGPKMGTG